MTDYTNFLLKSDSRIIEFETIQISHPDFTRSYRVVSNNTDGLTVALEDGTEANFEFYPLVITPSNSSSDLDFTIGIDFGDLGEVLPKEIDAVRAAGGFLTKPVLIYRSYRSDNLDEPMTGPIQLAVESITFNGDFAAFEASASSANNKRTGLFYKTNRFPTLANF